jgi:flagellar biosynthesis protein FlhG
VKDQATALRDLMAKMPRVRPAPLDGTPTLVIGSGKGGVGKSVLSVLTAGALAAEGARVLLVDGDQNLANLHVLLGVQPLARLETLLHGDGDPADLVVPVRDGLWLLPADSGAESLHGTTPIERARLHHRVSTMFADYDAVVVDSGAGIESVVRICTIAATSLVLVTLPEPAALTDAYAVLKIVNYQIPALPVDVMMNRSSDAEGRDAFEKLQAASLRFLTRDVEYLGAIPDDSHISRTIRSGGSLIDGALGGAAAQAVATATARWKAMRVPSPDSAMTAARS